MRNWQQLPDAYGDTSSAATSITVSGIKFNATPSATTLVIVASASASGATINYTSVAVRGTTLTKNIAAEAATFICGIHSGYVSGTTGDLVITVDAASLRWGWALWAIPGVSSATPANTYSDVANPFSQSVVLPIRGFTMIAGGGTNAFQNALPNLTGLGNEITPQVHSIQTNQHFHAQMYRVTGQAAETRTIAQDYDQGTSSERMVIATWLP